MTRPQIEYVDEPVGQFHHRTVSHHVSAIWIPRLDPKPTLVLGSRQSLDVVDIDRCRERGIDVVTRRSGGGAVLVGSEQLVWIDVIVPRDHPGWHDDVGRSFDWVSARMLDALSTLGISGTPHLGGLERTQWSDLICFAGLGPGEISVDGKKLVGISQRRTKWSSRFQIAALRHWSAKDMLDLFALEPSQADAGLTELRDVATGIGVAPTQLADAMVRAFSETTD